MFFEAFKASLLYARLPARVGPELAAAAVTCGFVLGALVLLGAGDRTLLAFASLGAAWFGARIALILVRRRRR